MATPKRRHKVRDKEQTRRALLDAVGEILMTDGFKGLTTNAIARHIGKDKNLVRYHFGSLTNLHRIFIMEKDYWPPVFEKFRLMAEDSEEKIRNTFIEIMLSNFSHFRETPVMQKIILWQISEENPLMRSVSEEREREGAKFLALSDKHFIGSGVSFRMLLALLLGGIYYNVLHAATNKSTVSGMDLNREKDREDLARTVEQMITWAWEKAGEAKTKKFKHSAMINELEALEIFLDQPGAEKKLGPRLDTIREEMLAALLEQRTEQQVLTWLRIHLFKLARVWDLLQASGRIDNAPFFKLYTSVLEPLKLHIPGDLPLPLMLSAKELEGFDAACKRIALRMEGLEPALIELTAIPFRRFALQRELKWADLDYLRNYAEILEEAISEGIKEQEVLELLLSLGLNHIRFSAFASAFLEAALPEGEKERKTAIGLWRKRLLRIPLAHQLVFDSRRQHPIEELLDWLGKESI